MAEVDYLEVADVIEIHLRFMEHTGARSSGSRGPDERESAVFRPRIAAFRDGADLIRRATLLAVAISQNQPFVDGNKRTTLAAADAFLRLNGYRTTGEGVEFAQQLEAMAERTDSLEAATDRFETWLRSNVQPRPHAPNGARAMVLEAGTRPALRRWWDKAEARYDSSAMRPSRARIFQWCQWTSPFRSVDGSTQATCTISSSGRSHAGSGASGSSPRAMKVMCRR